MRKIVVISDSFKGSMTSNEVNATFAKTAKKVFKDAEIIQIPIADGGEGTCSSLASIFKGIWIKAKVHNQYGEPITAKYFVREDGAAIIETASCDGLTLCKKKDPSLASTFGLGELVNHAIENGSKNFILGLGGSASNDGGTGLASALGTKFFDKDGNEFIPSGLTLSKINKIIPHYNKDINILCLSDVNNPLYGKNGAAYVFAPQKGADEKMVALLDDGLISLDKVIKKDLKKDISKVEGSGAAGGLGAGLLAFENASLISGIDFILKETHFDEVISDADLVVTGEGNFDSQSLNGKVISGILKHTKKAKIPLLIIAGGVSKETTSEISKNKDIIGVFSTNPNNEPLEKVMKNAKKYYAKAVKNILNNMKV